MQQQPVPLICAKPRGLRYNRRDIQFDERFEAVNEQDANVLIRAKLARPAPPETTARARATTAAAGDDRSRTVETDAGIPAAETAVLSPRDVASSTHHVPELGGTPAPKKKRVRNRKAKAPGSAPQL